MFVPGVNGSVIPSAPSGSKLKGAYKNSKKRKMPNGGIELALDAASFAPPPVGTVASLLGAGLNAYQGDYTGMGLDLASAASGGASKWFGAAADAAKMANSGRLASSMASKAKTFQTLSNPVVSKTASVGRDYSNTVKSSPYNNTMRVPQRDNAQVQFRPNPNLRKMDNGGWANWTPNTGKPYLRTSPAGNAGYSDNTKVITQNTNVTAANRKAAEAAEYAKRVGSISQGKVKSNYEKAKEATSFVAQAEQRNGSASPLDYVLDVVNPVNYVTNAIDLVGNTGSAVVNASQGNFAQAGSDLLGAGLNALDVVPLTRGLGKVAKPAIKNAARPFLNYADDIVQTSKIAGKPALPTYKNVYRAEHANFNTMAKPDDLTGRWALDNPKDAEFYVRNLKTPRGDSYTTSNYFKGEVEPVRIMRDRLPEYKMKQQFAEGMPEEARIMSMGRGKLTDKELASVLGDDAADRMRKGILTEMDYNTMSTAPFMYNTTEGILDANRINQLRKGENTFLGRGKTNLFPDQKQAIDYISNQSKGQKNSSLISKYLPFSTYKDGGTLPPRYTSNPNDPRLKAYQDSLYVRRLNPQTFTPGNRTRPLTQDEKIFWKDEKTGLVPNLVEYNPDRPTSGYFGHYKKPVQPYIYKKPEVVPEVVETSVAPIEPPVKKIGYNKPIIQQFNYMSNENKAKALQKYGSVSDIPFKGVDINQLKKGGEVEDDDDKEMVDGVASILRGVKDKKNRLQLANKLAKQFNREKVKYSLPQFLAKSKVKK